MLKITTTHEPQALRLVLEGRLVGPWLNELEQAWRSISDSIHVRRIVDLTGVTYIEENGRTVLSRMWREGAELIATGCCNKAIVEHITGSRSHSQSKQWKQRA